MTITNIARQQTHIKMQQWHGIKYILQNACIKRVRQPVDPTSRGVARNLFRRGTKHGDWGLPSSPQRGSGAEPWWRSEVKAPQKLKTYMLITIAIMC